MPAHNLSHNGKTEYVICLSREAAEPERFAAGELSDHLNQVTGADFKIISETDSSTAPKIVVGPGSLLDKDEVDNPGAEEFIIKTVGSDLHFIGGRPRGTLYAVYHFLDHIIGIRWWAPGAAYIPAKPDLPIEELDLKERPFFQYRDPYITTAWDKEWAVRSRLNGCAKPDAARGGYVSYGNSFVHTFDYFIPWKEHFDAHPDWFSFFNGKRIKDYNQLCLTNPEVLDFMTKQVLEELRKNPDVDIVSVSQNDNEFYCQCPACSKVAEEEGSEAGLMLRFVNSVAEAVEKEFPNVLVDTLAYQYTRRPPKHTRPRKNVIVRLCSIECSFSKPLTDPQNAKFADDMRGWSKVAPNIYVWDYVTNFRNYFRPHPNLRVLGPNLRFFAENSTRGVFEQGSSCSNSGEMEELRAWLLSRLLWDPYQDDNALTNEFLSGYYGKAAPFIRGYLDLIHDTVEKSDYYMDCFSGDPAPFVDPEVMSKAEELFALAESAVQAQPDILNRVKRAHMPVQCMWLMNYQPWAENAPQKYPHPKPFDQILADFTAQAEKDEVTLFSEKMPLKEFYVILKRKSENPAATASAVQADSCPSYAFDGNPETAWFAGSGNLNPQWIQIDRGKSAIMEAVRTDFINYYTQVTYKIEGSMDGMKWQTLVPERTSNEPSVYDIISSPIEARFVRTTVLSAYTGEAKRSVVVSNQEITVR